MDLQTFIVALLILAAIVYAGRRIWSKTKSFSGKSSCGSDCGCDRK